MCGYFQLTFQTPYTKPPKHLYLGKKYMQLGGEQGDMAEMLIDELMTSPAPFMEDHHRPDLTEGPLRATTAI